MLTCRDLVELVTDELEHALPEALHRAFLEHLGECTDCLRYVAQIQMTMRALRALGRA